MRFYSEKKLAEKIGLARGRLRELRLQCVKPEDIQRDGREVAVSEKGLGSLLEMVRATRNHPIPPDFDDCLMVPEKNNGPGPAAPAAPAAQLEELIVKRVFLNPRLLLATAPSGREVRVRVRNNQNFVVKMKLKARPIGYDFYQMEGRCPRFKGRY